MSVSWGAEGASERVGAGLASPIEEYLARLHARYRNIGEGDVATYIPELAKADPNWFGICLATTDGHVYEVGDTRLPFTIQSISKPFTYGLALADCGLDAVLRRIGVEPTGEAFNSISLAPGSGRPLNPMINAGAIAASSLVAGRSAADQLERILAVFALYAGRRLAVDWAVCESERATGHRNRAIGHMLSSVGILTADPTPALDLYFQQCSIAVDCRDLSLMAATLANGGRNPVTGERALAEELVPYVLSLMTTCGMYDYAGEWVYWVGMPAKSGVAGGVMCVLPGQLGIGVFSPPLDARGNSVRGIAVCKDLSRDLDLHVMRVPRSSRATLRAEYTLARVGSKRRRDDAARRVLDAMGERVRIVELQGDLMFAAAESVVRRVVDVSAAVDGVLLDCQRVSAIDGCAARMLLDLVQRCAARGQYVLFVAVQHHPHFIRFLEEQLDAAGANLRAVTFPDLDRGLEWCEERLLEHAGSHPLVTRSLPLAEHHICRGLTAAEIAQLEGVLERCVFPAGAAIIRKGDAAASIYLLTRGEVSVVLDLPNGQVKRLSTLSPGMTFGELAVVSHGQRNADVRADTAVECYALATTTFDGLGTSHPRIKMTLLENLLRNVSQMLTGANRELAALAE